MPLPLISYGGSSTLTVAICIGLADEREHAPVHGGLRASRSRLGGRKTILTTSRPRCYRPRISCSSLQKIKSGQAVSSTRGMEVELYGTNWYALEVDGRCAAGDRGASSSLLGGRARLR
ncbi:MAG: hypothetical protein MZV70_50485 [Desulfobacterales bacterium]|nr:hypothetical protein [Desulfobacterales bacterium]